jgi:hypothetical protein
MPRLRITRIPRPDIIRLFTATLQIELAEGQCFYETQAGYEIWQGTRLVKQIPHNRVRYPRPHKTGDRRTIVYPVVTRTAKPE